MVITYSAVMQFCIFIITLVSLSVPVLDFYINILFLFVELKREKKKNGQNE
jgi:hypothetical protein